jgi:hypothetical protein
LVEIIGFRRIADTFGIRHAFKKHGSAAVEEIRVRQRELAFQTLYKRKIRKP